MFKIYFLITSLFLLSSCGNHEETFNDKEGLSDQAVVAMEALLSTPNEIVYADVKKYILDVSCLECHSSNTKQDANVSLGTYDEVFGKDGKRKVLVPYNSLQSQLYKVLTLSFGSLKMPPSHKPQLSENQKNMVFQWINNGAKNKKSQVVKRPESLAENLQPYFVDPKMIDYKIVKEVVFKQNCLKCHSSESKDADVNAIKYGQDMTTFGSLFKNSGIVPNKLVNKLVAGKKVKGSKIYKSIAVNQTMPPSKDGYEPLDSLRIKILRLWILNCAIEDYASIKDSDSLLPPLEEDEERIEGKIRDCSLSEN